MEPMLTRSVSRSPPYNDYMSSISFRNLSPGENLKNPAKGRTPSKESLTQFTTQQPKSIRRVMNSGNSRPKNSDSAFGGKQWLKVNVILQDHFVRPLEMFTGTNQAWQSLPWFSLGNPHAEEVCNRVDALAASPFISPLLADDQLLSRLPPTYLLVSVVPAFQLACSKATSVLKVPRVRNCGGARILTSCDASRGFI